MPHLMTAASAAASSVLRVTPAPASRPRALVCPLRAVVAGKDRTPLPVEDDERTEAGRCGGVGPSVFQPARDRRRAFQPLDRPGPGRLLLDQR